VCLTIHLYLKDFADLSSVTVNKLHTPSLHVFAAGRWLNEPARRGGIRCILPRRIKAHEKPHAAAAFCGELQPPRLDLSQTRNGRDSRADPATTQTFSQRPELIRMTGAAEQDKVSKIDPRGDKRRQMKLALWIAPGDSAAVGLRSLGE
jgi:hypothetical protein